MLDTYESMGPRARAIMDELCEGREEGENVAITDIADDFMIQAAEQTVSLVLDAPFAFEGSTDYQTGETKPGWDELGPEVAERALITCMGILSAQMQAWDDMHGRAVFDQQMTMKPTLRLAIADWQDTRERENDPATYEVPLDGRLYADPLDALREAINTLEILWDFNAQQGHCDSRGGMEYQRTSPIPALDELLAELENARAGA